MGEAADHGLLAQVHQLLAVFFQGLLSLPLDPHQAYILENQNHRVQDDEGTQGGADYHPYYCLVNLVGDFIGIIVIIPILFVIVEIHQIVGNVLGEHEELEHDEDVDDAEPGGGGRFLSHNFI